MATTQVSLPGYREPVFDGSGNISRPWWLFFQSLSKVIGGGSVPDLSAIIQMIQQVQAQADAQAFAPEPTGVADALRGLGELRAMVEMRTEPDLNGIRRRLDDIEALLLDIQPFNFAQAMTGVQDYAEATASGVALTNSTAANITSLPLTPGDWDVWGNVSCNPGTGTAFSVIITGINTVSGTIPASPLYSQWSGAGTTNFGQTGSPPQRRLVLTAPTTIYLVSNIGFAGGTATANGILAARRRKL